MAYTGSGTFWEVAADELPFGHLQGDEGLTTSSSDLNILFPVNCMSQAEVAVHNAMPGGVLRHTHSSRSSVVSRVLSRRNFANVHSDIDRVAREAEMQVQNEEVTLRDSTVAAQLLAQSKRAQAAKTAKAAKAAVDQAQVQAQAAQAQAAVAQAQAQAQAAGAQAQAAQAQTAVARAQSLADEAADAVTLVDIESQTRARAVESIEARSRISL
jgi:regulator of protease activity HflC (stomatin/prohibitin superfamily)